MGIFDDLFFRINKPKTVIIVGLGRDALKDEISSVLKNHFKAGKEVLVFDADLKETEKIEFMIKHSSLPVVVVANAENEEQIKIAAGWFTKYGAVMVFVARLIPGFRTIISFPAGAVKMPLAKFLAYTLAGCLVWNTLLIYVGYYLGTNWTEVASISHYLIIGAIAVLVTAAAVYLVVRRQKRKKWLLSQQESA